MHSRSLLVTGLLIFRAVAEPRISTKSAKSREIHQNTRNPAKSARNLTKYMSAQYIWKLSGCWGCLLAVNVLIYLETSSPQRGNNILKLPGVLGLMLRKPGKQRCKNPGVPSEDRGNWGWEGDGLFIVCSLFVKNAASCEGSRLIRSSHLQRWRSFSERLIRSTNSNARKPAKWAKFMLVLTR